MMMKALVTYHVVAVVLFGSPIIPYPVSNAFTVPMTQRVASTRPTLPSSSTTPPLSGNRLILSSTVVLYGSKNTIRPRLLRSDDQKPTSFQRKKKKAHPISEFTLENVDEDDNEDDDEDVEQEEEFIEFAMDDDDNNINLGGNDDRVPPSTIIPTNNNEVVVTETTSTLTNHQRTTIPTNNNNNSDRKVKVQYCALEPGTVIQIEVGDISRARKAWKKRRRSDSPLLIPCSILSVNRRSAVRYNCMYLLEKFGSSTTTTTTRTTTTTTTNANHHRNVGISISLTELSMRYRTHLKSSLLHHATQLGYSNSYDLMTHIFHPSVQEAYGVHLVTTTTTTTTTDRDESTEPQQPNGPVVAAQPQLFLQTPLTRTRAHSRAANAAILQFIHNEETTNSLDHTGLVRIKKQSSPRSPSEMEQPVEPVSSNADAGARTNVETSKNTNFYSLVPLSVALRVSSEDVLENLVYTGSRHAAVVFDYDVTGDANILPLITLSLNPQRNQVRDRYKRKNTNNPNKSLRQTNSKKESGSTAITKWMHELKVGDGPYPGKVVRLVKGGAIVDCNVYRYRWKPTAATAAMESSPSDDASIPVMGVLRFKDAVLSESATLTPIDQSATDDDEIESDDDEEEDSDWNNIFSIDELNNFDDDDDDEEEEEELLDESDENLDDLDVDDDEVLAAFNLENDDEFAEGEDITHLFNIKEDGTLEYTDPATGITQVISDVNIQDEHDDDDEEEDDEDEYDEDMAEILAEFDDEEFDEDDYEDEDDADNDGPVLLSTFDKASGRTRKVFTEVSVPKYRTQTLRVGDTVDVYMKSISKQSNQLFLSMDASIQGKKAKDMKKETDVNKKVNRLVKQLGGYQRLRELDGTICNGTIKATSNTGGDWYYVQPDMVNLPVGVATTVTDDANKVTWNVGDIVQIQLKGIDPDRGQLAMKIIGGGDSV